MAKQHIKVTFDTSGLTDPIERAKASFDRTVLRDAIARQYADTLRYLDDRPLRATPEEVQTILDRAAYSLEKLRDR